ncbi:MAG: hypothetical protein JW726_06410, partial [Anaerolineales bacterium]|nr:hypothetical protein [Anaerolineales bacterium]
MTALENYAILTAMSSQKPAPRPSEAQKTLRTTLNLVMRFQRFSWDVAGVLLLALALLTLLAIVFPPLAGEGILKNWGGFVRLMFGWGGILVVVGSGLAGLVVLRQRANRAHSLSEPAQSAIPQVRWGRVIALELSAFAGLAFLSLLGGSSVTRAEASLDGGLVGWGLVEILGILFQRFGILGWLVQAAILGVAMLGGLVYGLGLAGPLRRKFQRWAQPHIDAVALASEPVISMAPAGEQAALAVGDAKKRRALLPAEFRKKFQVSREDERAAPPQPRDERLPPLELLVYEASSRPDERNINQTAGLIEKTLADFGVPAKVIGFRIGPTVTQFAVEPGFLKNGSEDEAKQKVRVSQIASLRRDLALALAAERLRIEAPVPGQSYIGIEVPNLRTTVVRLRPILESEAFYKINSPLAIALGRDVSGLPVVADLMSMPHLLIAGTTGSGKSVCIAALTTCLVFNNPPEDLRLVMIDPKMVELVRFNGLPHLYGKVETDIQRILGVLRWVVVEMDRRYKLLEVMNARHLDAYNRKARRHKGAEVLPRIVVMIDELADLMMTAPDQTEHNLIRLAQMARATGIHLVVATQRPSTDIITGLIKANFPARLSFAVASSVDSRVILDSGGAEALLGHGDMLFQPPEAPAPLRSQGVMISDQEVEKVITFWQRTHPRDENALPPWEALLEEEAILAD